jgi:hypothetical protein
MSFKKLSAGGGVRPTTTSIASMPTYATGRSRPGPCCRSEQGTPDETICPEEPPSPHPISHEGMSLKASATCRFLPQLETRDQAPPRRTAGKPPDGARKSSQGLEYSRGESKQPGLWVVVQFPGVKIGLFCTTPMVPLVRAIPTKPALEMLLTGKPISAARALELGLVNRVVGSSELDAAVQEFVDAILASSPLTVRLGKAAFYDQLALDEATAYDRATCVMVDNAVRADAQEGIQAFLQKRRPVWTGK